MVAPAHHRHRGPCAHLDCRCHVGRVTRPVYLHRLRGEEPRGDRRALEGIPARGQQLLLVFPRGDVPGHRDDGGVGFAAVSFDQETGSWR